MEKGELHFRDSIIRTYGSKENALKALKAAMAARGESDGNIGFNARAVVKEPTVFINIANYKKIRDILSCVRYPAWFCTKQRMRRI